MKRRLLAILMVWMLACVSAVPAWADTGPKPSVNITVEGLEGKEYAVTLIAPYAQCGPWNAERAYEEDDGDIDSWNALKAYQDVDGYHFLGYWADCGEQNEFNWRYMPPKQYKVLIWVKTDNTYLVSEPTENYAFDSYYTVKANAANGSIQLRKSYDYTWELISFAARVVITVVLELALAWVFGWRAKQTFKVLLYTNLATQLALNVILNVVNYYKGCMVFSFAFVVLELVVFLVEGSVYRKYLPTRTDTGKKRNVWVYALFANAFSYLAGVELAKWIPGIF